MYEQPPTKISNYTVIYINLRHSRIKTFGSAKGRVCDNEKSFIDKTINSALTARV